MIQEHYDILLGMDLNEGGVQLTYYTRAMSEPVTVHPEPEQSGYRIQWPEDERSGEGLGRFFTRCFALVPGADNREALQLMLTMRRLEKDRGDELIRALTELGLQRKHIFLQDYKSSFYFFTVNQKKELWNYDVALFEYVDDALVGSILHMDKTTRPATVTVAEAARQPMGEEIRDGREGQEWQKEQDRLFFELLKRTFERRNVSTAYLVGEYFEQGWADRSFQYLCTRRHAFQGENLFSRGACYAAMERAGMISLSGLLFMGEDMICSNLGMELRIRGKLSFYPMISAGINWYDAYHTCEMVLDEGNTLTIQSLPMTGGDPVFHVIRLTGLPERPRRATRLRLTLYFTGAETCCAEVEDLGFGGLFRSSKKRWESVIHLAPPGEGRGE